ncbi:hypothetical protein MKW92_003499 [Papaver armeniacum]|nr:hypothetical protein MKW92_003499 [Papaver armeniacum]
MGTTLDVEEEEWVTVYGDIKSVLSEFEKCGWILEHVEGSDAANWVHILYQNRSDAQIALSKNGMQMNKDVILGVKSVDPIKRQELDEEWVKKQASGANRQVVDPARIERALNQCLHLLHRSEGDFFVLGETGNVYTVTLSRIPSCNCPDWNAPCKHMLFVFLRVLRVSQGDDCLQSKTLKQWQVARLLNTPSSPQTLAGARACEKFRHLYSTMSNVGPPQKIPLKIGQQCPYCEGDLNEAASYDSAVECEACHEVGHESCMVTSKVRRGGKIAKVVGLNGQQYLMQVGT